MFTRQLYLGLALLLTMPVWSQVVSSTPDATTSPDDGIRMELPPPVSIEPYPTFVGSESRSNYLRAALIFNTAYIDNVVPGESTHPVSDQTYSIWPTITLDQTSSRQHRMFTYSPGFTLYQKTSELNNVDQNATLDFQYRLSPHASIGLRDSFQKSSNVLNQPNSLSGSAISGSPQPAAANVLAPFANQITNVANVDLSYQFARNGMIGGGGTFTNLHFLDPALVIGLSDSNSRGASTFYSQRLSGTQYLGVTYQYVRSQTNPENVQSVTQTHAPFFFYTLYLKRTFSLSLSGGPQYVQASQSLSPPYHAWVSAGMASISWQSNHTNVAASYSRTVTGGGGLSGAFNTKTVNASARWQIRPTWTVGSAASYVVNDNVTPLFFLSSPGGHSVSGTGSVQHSVNEHFMAELGYARLHQSYKGIAVISNDPDTDRVFFSVSYQFARPVGR